MKRQPPRTVSNALMIFITVLALGGGFTLGWLFSRERIPTSSPGPGAEDSTMPTGQVPGRGRIEPATGVLHLGPGTPDRVVKINVKEGDTVEEGKVLVELESLKERQLALDMARTRRKDAEAQREAIDKGSAAEIRTVKLQREQLDVMYPYERSAQQRKIDLLEKQYESALANWKRVRGVSGDTISAQDRDQTQILLEQSTTQLKEARLALEQLEAKQKLEKALLEAKEEAARSKAAQAKSEISLPLVQQREAQVKEQMEQSLLRAPVRGKILHVMTRVGELVGAKPIIDMANVDQMEVTAEIHESFRWRVKVGQDATITSKIPVEGQRDDKMHGKVIHVGSTLGQQSLYGLDPHARRDDRVFEVKIRLETSERAAQLIGHQVDVAIDAPPLSAH